MAPRVRDTLEHLFMKWYVPAEQSLRERHTQAVVVAGHAAKVKNEIALSHAEAMIRSYKKTDERLGCR